MKPTHILSWALAALLLCVTVHAFPRQSPEPKDSPTIEPKATPAPPAPISPSPAFLADFDAYVKTATDVMQLQQKLKNTKEWRAYQDASDRAVGMQLRIQREVPGGWRFDPKTRMFVALPPRPQIGNVPMHAPSIPVKPAPAPAETGKP
jgi:hypothetical protein